MKIMILYDSYFGNTEQIALAIATSLSENAQVETIRAGDFTADKLRDQDAVIIGSPTRGFQPTELIKKFLKLVTPNALSGIRFAAFDTRLDLDTIDSSTLRFLVKKGGYAANSIAKTIKHKGGILQIPPEGFLVLGEKGPLKDGELERAASWALQIFD